MVEREELALASSVGFVSACLAFVEVMAYVVAVAAPGGEPAGFFAAVLMTPTLLTMFVSLHYSVPLRKRLWTHLALSFAVLYAGLCGVSYFVQLAFVRLNMIGVGADLMRLYAFAPGSPLYAQDVLGFFFLSLAALAAVPALPDDRVPRRLRALLMAHGACSIVPLVFALVRLPDSLTGSSAGRVAQLGNLGWCLFFAPIAGLLAIYFRRLEAPAVAATVDANPVMALQGAGFRERWVSNLRAPEPSSPLHSGTPVFAPTDATQVSGSVFPMPSDPAPIHEPET